MKTGELDLLNGLWSNTERQQAIMQGQDKALVALAESFGFFANQMPEVAQACQKHGVQIVAATGDQIRVEGPDDVIDDLLERGHLDFVYDETNQWALNYAPKKEG